MTKFYEMSDTEASQKETTFEPIKPDVNGPHWTKTRNDVHSWLNRHSKALAELYAGCIVAIYEVHFPGRFTFICHAVREIRNRLPEIVSGSKRGGRLDYTSKMDAISSVWEKEFGGTYLSEKQPSIPQTLTGSEYNLSPDLYRQIDAFVKKHLEARQKPEENASLLFKNGTASKEFDSIAPLLFQWVEITTWFADRAHFTGKADNESNWEDLAKRFELFENTLAAIDREFYTTAGGLDEILERANS